MTTYLVIGMIIQLYVLIKGYIRFPEFFAQVCEDREIMVITIGASVCNILIWPVILVSEIYNFTQNQ